jgi:cytochrome c oxidase assembly protein subunit 17
MGASQSKAAEHSKEEPKKCKPCCACPDTRKLRDECVILKGEEECADLIKAHQECMKKMGFNV